MEFYSFNTGSAGFSNYVVKGTNRVFFVVETHVVCFVAVCWCMLEKAQCFRFGVPLTMKSV